MAKCTRATEAPIITLESVPVPGADALLWRWAERLQRLGATVGRPERPAGVRAGEAADPTAGSLAGPR